VYEVASMICWPYATAAAREALRRQATGYREMATQLASLPRGVVTCRQQLGANDAVPDEPAALGSSEVDGGSSGGVSDKVGPGKYISRHVIGCHLTRARNFKVCVDDVASPKP